MPLHTAKSVAGIAWMREHPFGDADAVGIDLTLIERCLSISPLERVRRNWLASLNSERARVDPRVIDAMINGRC